MTTLHHEGTPNTAGGLQRHTKVELMYMYRMQLCPLSTGITYRLPTEDFSMLRAHLPACDAMKQITWRHNQKYYSPQHRSEPSNFYFQRVS
jgi:hypothetical protein